MEYYHVIVTTEKKSKFILKKDLLLKELKKTFINPYEKGGSVSYKNEFIDTMDIDSLEIIRTKSKLDEVIEKGEGKADAMLSNSDDEDTYIQSIVIRDIDIVEFGDNVTKEYISSKAGNEKRGTLQKLLWILISAVISGAVTLVVIKIQTPDEMLSDIVIREEYRPKIELTKMYISEPSIIDGKQVIWGTIKNIAKGKAKNFTFKFIDYKNNTLPVYKSQLFMSKHLNVDSNESIDLPIILFAELQNILKEEGTIIDVSSHVKTFDTKRNVKPVIFALSLTYESITKEIITNVEEVYVYFELKK
jgi:hypothetical protein